MNGFQKMIGMGILCLQGLATFCQAQHQETKEPGLQVSESKAAKLLNSFSSPPPIDITVTEKGVFTTQAEYDAYLARQKELPKILKQAEEQSKAFEKTKPKMSPVKFWLTIVLAVAMLISLVGSLNARKSDS